jgi:hypothetical protein
MFWNPLTHLAEATMEITTYGIELMYSITPGFPKPAAGHSKMSQPSMRSIIYRHFHRLLFGDPERKEQKRVEEAAREAWNEAHPWPKSLEDFPRDQSKPYCGQPVPKEALLEGVEPGGRFLLEWHETWRIVLVGNGRDVLVFPVLFVTELETGEVIYDEEDRRAEDWPGDPGKRMAPTIKIHERLEDGGERSERVVKFLGSSPSCYRIENLLSNGSVEEVSSRSKQSDTALALHQRWALQYLSACRYIHDKGIVINAPPGECTFLRSDLSLVVAGFVDASCREFGILAGFWEKSGTVCSPFSPHDAPRGSDAYAYRNSKTDLFAWACWAYELMTDGRNPLLPPDKEEGKISPQEMRARENAVQKGLFKHWPILPEDQLGPCLVKAWKGEYEGADDGFREVKAVLERHGRIFVAGEDDEFEGFDWEAEFSPFREDEQG